MKKGLYSAHPLLETISSIEMKTMHLDPKVLVNKLDLKIL